mmetsp:Transcript_31171/g.66166  ORF Transcript_31171/g.66166 Transcript_31171/m.66166 type:complete len:139 (-) Transcript_31171:1681-2097(-)
MSFPPGQMFGHTRQQKLRAGRLEEGLYEDVRGLQGAVAEGGAQIVEVLHGSSHFQEQLQELRPHYHLPGVRGPSRHESIQSHSMDQLVKCGNHPRGRIEAGTCKVSHVRVVDSLKLPEMLEDWCQELYAPPRDRCCSW